QPISTFAAAKGKAVKSRAVETTITNLSSFTMNAFQDGEANYMKDVKYTSTDGSVWNTDAGTFYWPVEGNLHFYAYAPEQPGQAGTFKLDKDAQTLTDFVPNTAAADQKDFVYAKSTGNNKANGTTGIDIDFQHALSEVTIAAKNENTAYTVDVTGVKIGNVIKKGTFTFPSTSDAAASWTLSSDVSDVTDYTTTWTTPVTLGSDVSTLDATNVPFMILPQQLSKATKASEKSYIAVKVKITLQGGYIQKDDWVYVGIDTNWEMGKRYAYTLDFTSGAGQDEDGKQVISGTAINLNVDVTPWVEVAEDLDPSGVVPTRPSVANSLIIDPTSTKAYGINIADKINAFWSSAVGDQTTPIVAGTEWTAEVIWQDIPSRAINFCSKSGVVKSGDTFEGKGTTPLYVKAAANVKGNVVVGIKKKGESDYLWSWHLWLTDEPQLVAGFMDRNLGAESATATDGAKTRGFYY
ncbi:fimbrillin family protein, partial [Prevotella copri]|uniref:fimbrillin family protein n=1 Tax=Segatella copri TaxID=165179 RepID=UPI0012919752